MVAFLQMVEGAPALREQINLVALCKKIYRRLGFSDETEIFIAASPEGPVDTPQPNHEETL